MQPPPPAQPPGPHSPYQFQGQPPGPYAPYTYPQATPGPMPPPQPKGRSTTAIVAAVVLIIVVVVVAAIVLFNFFRTSPASPTATPNVNVTNTSGTYSCPVFGTPAMTWSFTLVNSGNANAYADLGFYLNDVLVTSNSYYAPAGSSASYTETGSLSTCPSSGATYYIQVLSVTQA